MMIIILGWGDLNQATTFIASPAGCGGEYGCGSLTIVMLMFMMIDDFEHHDYCRQSLLVSVSVFLFGFVSDTITDTIVL